MVIWTSNACFIPPLKYIFFIWIPRFVSWKEINSFASLVSLFGIYLLSACRRLQQSLGASCYSVYLSVHNLYILLRKHKQDGNIRWMKLYFNSITADVLLQKLEYIENADNLLVITTKISFSNNKYTEH